MDEQHAQEPVHEPAEQAGRAVGRRVLGYGRQSRGNQKSIDDQREIYHRDVDEQGWVDAGWLSDRIGASRYSTRERDAWPLVIEMIEGGEGKGEGEKEWEEEGVDLLWLWESSRGDRKAYKWLHFLEVCLEEDVHIYIKEHDREYDLSNPNDWEVLADEGIKSQRESDKISKRVKRGVTSNASVGIPHGREVWGYKREWSKESGKREFVGQYIVEEYAEVVREIFHRFSKGEAISAITLSLMSENRPEDVRKGPRGTGWDRKTVRNILTNKHYIGIREYREWEKGKDVKRKAEKKAEKKGEKEKVVREYRGQWEPIIEEDVFWKVQRILSDPERKTTKPGKAKYLLTWLIHCECRAYMGGRVPRNDVIYTCSRQGHNSIRAEFADKIVGDAVVKILGSEDEYAQWLRDNHDDRELRRARAELDRLEIERDQILEMWGPGDDHATRLNLLRKFDHEISKRQDIIRDAVTIDDIRADLSAPKIAWARWHGASMFERRELIKKYVSVVVEFRPEEERRTRESFEAAENRMVITSKLIPENGE
jgi:site-specific DNA recombinase